MPVAQRLKPNKQCQTCVAVANDPVLMRRISLCKHFVPGGEPLSAIERDYIGTVSHRSLYNHVAMHQARNKTELDKKIKQFGAKQAYSEIVGEETTKAVTVYSGHIQARKELLQKGMEALERGDLKMTMNAVVSLLGQEQKAEEAAKDRSLAMMKMFNYFASGSSPSPGGPLKTDVEEGEITGSGTREAPSA